MFDDGYKDQCVIMIEVTGTDRPSVWFEKSRWMDGRTHEVGVGETCLWLGRCQKRRTGTVEKLAGTNSDSFRHIYRDESSFYLMQKILKALVSISSVFL